jgi:hypothetical protein
MSPEAVCLADAVRDVDPAYAIIRVDLDVKDDEARFTLGDRETGKALRVTLWESDEAREASDATAGQIRPRVEQETGGTMRAVERYDVLFFDVRAE